LYSSPHILGVSNKIMRRAGHVVGMAEVRNACKILAGKPEEQVTLKRPRRDGRIV
jgi:hypothetical protein